MTFAIQQLTHRDIDSAQSLVELAGWNQLPEDWRRLVRRESQGCFKATRDGKLLGTVTTIAYGTEMAWIGMMLVHPAARRQGIGRELMHRAIDYLKVRGVRAIGLDATPAGRPLYEQLGFHVSSEWQRWQYQLDAPASGSPVLLEQAIHSLARRADSAVDGGEQGNLRLDSNPEIDSHLRELDRQAFGVDRWSWIEQLCQSSQLVASDQGYGLLRRGRVASYLGPVVATDTSVAQSLIERLLASCTISCLWDVPSTNPQAEALVRQLGFEPLRVLYRMWLDQVGPRGEPQQLFAISDPATG